MNDVFHLQPDIWQRLLQSPDLSLAWIQDQYRVEIRLIPLLDSAEHEEIETPPKTSSPANNSTPANTSTPPRASIQSKTSTLATNYEISTIKSAPRLVDIQDFFQISSDDLEVAAHAPPSSKIEALPTSPLETERPSASLPVIQGLILEENESPSSEIALDTADIVPEEPSLLKNRAPAKPAKLSSPYRLLRAADTPLVLKMLAQRLSVPLAEAAPLLILWKQESHLLQRAKEAYISHLLSTLVPISDAPHEIPTRTIVGVRRDQRFCIWRNSPLGNFRFDTLPSDGGSIQIALYQGEALLTEEEFAQLFSKSDRALAPAKAQERAQHIFKQLQGQRTLTQGSVPQMMNIQALQQQPPQQHALPVDPYLLQRLERHRLHEEPQIWNRTLQPGVAVLTQHAATLFQDGKPMIEGILIYILERKQYMLFDQRSRRYLTLLPNPNQHLLLRRQ